MTPRTIVLVAALILASLPATAGQIHDAAAAGDKAKVASLLAADRTAVNAPGDDRFKSMPLHVAAEKGHLEIVRLLLDAGATVDGFDSDQSTPLDLAAKEGHQEAVALLLERGADVNRRDRNGGCAMSFAMGRAQTAVVRQTADVSGMKVTTFPASDAGRRRLRRAARPCRLRWPVSLYLVDDGVLKGAA